MRKNIWLDDLKIEVKEGKIFVSKGDCAAVISIDAIKDLRSSFGLDTSIEAATILIQNLQQYGYLFPGQKYRCYVTLIERMKILRCIREARGSIG